MPLCTSSVEFFNSSERRSLQRPNNTLHFAYKKHAHGCKRIDGTQQQRESS
jgi:hypothetical protein